MFYPIVFLIQKLHWGPIFTGKNGYAKFFVFANIFVKVVDYSDTVPV